MNYSNQKKTASNLHADLAYSVELFGEFMSLDAPEVPKFIRNQALMRRFNVGFMALFTYLCEITGLPEEEQTNMDPEQIAEYFVKKGVLDGEDEELFLRLTAITMASRVCHVDVDSEEKIIELCAEPLYQLLKKVVDSTMCKHAL